LFLRSTQHANW